MEVVISTIVGAILLIVLFYIGILLDYEMPVCDGRMTLEMIRADEEMKDIPVVFLTAINDRANIEAVLKLKPAGYFLKPPVKDHLLGEIEKILHAE